MRLSIILTNIATIIQEADFMERWLMTCTSTKTRGLWPREGSKLRERIKKEERGQGRKTTSFFFFILAALGNFSRNKNPAKHYCKITYYGKKQDRLQGT